MAEGHALKKKENPYLSHKPSSFMTEATTSNELQSMGDSLDEKAGQEAAFDDRLKVRNRDVKMKKAFNFVESGAYIAREDALIKKEERKIIAGYTSGRKAPEIVEDVDISSSTADKVKSVMEIEIPQPNDENLVPSIEWYDEIFLPKDLREKRKQAELVWKKIIMTCHS